LAATEHPSTYPAARGSKNQKQSRSAKRKYDDDTLLSQAFRDKEGEALQLAWTETQAIWPILEQFLREAQLLTPSMESPVTTLSEKFLTLCTELSDKTCVSNPTPVQDVADAWYAVRKLLSPADDQQHPVIQFGKELETFREKVELHIDIGQCLDEKEEKGDKARRKRRRSDKYQSK
jgi:hypothetical protein